MCDNCGSRGAVVHLTQVVNNEITTSHLCEACAAEKGLQPEAAPPDNLPLADFLAKMGGDDPVRLGDAPRRTWSAPSVVSPPRISRRSGAWGVPNAIPPSKPISEAFFAESMADPARGEGLPAPRSHRVGAGKAPGGTPEEARNGPWTPKTSSGQQNSGTRSGPSSRLPDRPWTTSPRFPTSAWAGWTPAALRRRSSSRPGSGLARNLQGTPSDPAPGSMTGKRS